MYRRGSLRTLRPLAPDTPGIPVIVDHNDDQRVGTVDELRHDWDSAGHGIWWVARATIDDPPEWLGARETRASFAFIPLAQRSVGDWQVIDDAVITEITLLSPRRTPADSLARVELLYDPETSPITRSPRPAAPILEPHLRQAQEDARQRGILIRPGIGQVLGVR